MRPPTAAAGRVGAAVGRVALWFGLGLPVAAVAASEPAWVQDYTVAATSGPPTTSCATAVTSRAPASPSPSPPVSEPAPPPSQETMLPYDVTPGAANTQLPDPIRAALQLGQPYDLAALPLEPLHGSAADIAKVRAVIQAASDARSRGRTVRVVAWGASHVAGEFLTGELRRLLQDRGGEGGHGFVMPAAPWKGYRASDLNLCTSGAWASDYDGREGGHRDGLLGPMGISVEAATSASSGWVQTTTSNTHGRTVSRFEVLFLRQPGGGHVDLVVDNAAAVRVATGADAVGPGAAVLHVPDGPHRLTVTPAGDGPVRLFGVNMDRDEPGVVVDAAGVVGKTASSWLHWDEALQGAFLARRPPDLAVLAYGTNEANDPHLTPERYRDELRAVLTRMRRVVPTAACLLVGPSDRGKKVSGGAYVIWPRTEWVARVQREVGPEFRCATWDLQAATGGPGSMFRWREQVPSLAAADLIHFSAEGYREVARRLLAAMDAPGG